MKAVLVIEMPNEYADRYNVNEMYVWGLTVQDKHGYEMFDLVTDKPSHLRPLPEKQKLTVTGKNQIEKKRIIKSKSLEQIKKGFINNSEVAFYCGYNDCLNEITGETE